MSMTANSFSGVYPKIARVVVSFRDIFIIRCGWDGKLWSSHAGLSENKVTQVVACAIGADLSANRALPDYLDNHENFAAEAAPTGLVIRPAVFAPWPVQHFHRN